MKDGNYLSEYAFPYEALGLAKRDAGGVYNLVEVDQAIDPREPNHFRNWTQLPEEVVKAREKAKAIHLSSAMHFDKTVFLEDKEEIKDLARRLGLSTRKDTLSSTGVLLANLIQLVTLDETNCIKVSMDNNRWGHNQSGNPLGVTASICKQLHLLADNGWGVIHSGYLDRRRGKGEQSRFEANTQLKELLLKSSIESLRVTDKGVIRRKSLHKDIKTNRRKTLPVEESDFPQHVKDTQLALINFNEFISNQCITLERPYKPAFRDLIAFNVTYYGDDFTLHSRIHGGRYQQISKDLRREQLRINGKRTVEVDITESHPTILYALAGCPLSVDQLGKAYWVHDIEPSGLERKTIKKAFAKIVNADSPAEAKKSIQKAHNTDDDFDANRFGGVKRLMQIIEERHEKIKSLFYSKSSGMKCFQLEGSVMLTVTSYLQDRGIVALPLHDGVIVCEKDSCQAKEVLVKVVKQLLNTEVLVEIK